MFADSRSSIRIVLLLANASSIALLIVGVTYYPRFLRQHGAVALLIEALGLLTLYFLLIVWGTRKTLTPSPILVQSTVLGLSAGVLQVIHLSTERFFTLPQRWNGKVVLLFMLATFAIWAIAGFNAARAGQPMSVSVWAASWSAIVTMSLAVVTGVALELFLAPLPLESMRAWAEFQRSGWTDLHAFAIANTLDSVTSHLLIGPVVASIVGAIGSLAARATRSFPASCDPHVP